MRIIELGVKPKYNQKEYINTLVDNVEILTQLNVPSGLKSALISCCKNGKPMVELSNEGVGRKYFEAILNGGALVDKYEIEYKRLTLEDLFYIGKFFELGVSPEGLFNMERQKVQLNSRELAVLYYTVKHDKVELPERLRDCKSRKMYNLRHDYDKDGNKVEAYIIDGELRWEVATTREEITEREEKRKKTETDRMNFWHNPSTIKLDSNENIELTMESPDPECASITEEDAQAYSEILRNLKGVDHDKITLNDLMLLNSLREYGVNPQVAIDNRLTANEIDTIVIALKIGKAKPSDFVGNFRGKDLEFDQQMGLLGYEPKRKSTGKGDTKSDIYNGVRLYLKRGFIYVDPETKENKFELRGVLLRRSDYHGEGHAVCNLPVFDYEASPIAEEVIKGDYDFKGR